MDFIEKFKKKFRFFILKKMNFKTIFLRTHHKSLRPLKYYTLNRRLRNDVVEDIPKPTPMRKTFNELLKRDLTVPNLKSVKKFPKAKEDSTESKVEKSQSILEKLRAAAKKKEDQ